MLQRVHSSWLLALASAGFAGGVALALVFNVPGVLGLLALASLPMLIGAGRVYTLAPTVALGVLAGVSYGSVHQLGREGYAAYIGATISASGRVKEDISKSSTGNYSIQLDGVELDGQLLPGTVLVTTRTTGGALRGDTMYLRAKVREGFGSFPATLSALDIQGVTRQQYSDIGRELRDGFAATVRTVIPDPQASLGIGFLTGQKSALPPDLADALKVAGLTHIVVASGYNLTILVGLARKLFLKLSKFLSAVTAGGMIILFVMMTGLSPSMTRAGLVSSMSLLAWYYGRAFHPFVLLPLAAAITVLFQPSYVWGDMGWQLSFAAFFGVMVVAPLMQAYFFGDQPPGVLRQVLGETIAAHIVTVPIIVLGFGVVSHVAIVANLLVVPLVPLAMLLTFLSGVGALLQVPYIELLATPTTWLLAYMTNVAEFVAEIPWAQSELQLSGIVWVAYCLVLLLACWWMQRATRYNFRSGEPVAC